VETADIFRGQRIVGGNVALDLLNTQDGPAGGPPEGDVLVDYSDFVAWAVAIGLVTDREAEQLRRRARKHPRVAEAAFERARSTRASLHELFEAVARGSVPSPADLATLQRDAADAYAHGRIVGDNGSFRWTWDGEGDLERPLWPIVHAALTLVTDGPLDRVKGCASCRYLFVDESKNRSRRWCSMEDCGAEDKMRKYVARRAQRRAGGTPGGALAC